MNAIEYTPAAAKALLSMPKGIAGKLVAKIEAFAAAPFAQHAFAKRLVGSSHTRIRQGDWRAVVSIDNGRLVVVVVKVGHRREVYD